jgi:hypothetical protein
MAHRTAHWSFVMATVIAAVMATLCFAVPAAFAQNGEMFAKFRVSCGPDYQRFCVGVVPGEGRIAKCLFAHRTELSGNCRSFMRAQIAARRNAPGGYSPPPPPPPQAAPPTAPSTIPEAPPPAGPPESPLAGSGPPPAGQPDNP